MGERVRRRLPFRVSSNRNIVAPGGSRKMDDRRFDSWSKALAARGSRRQALAKGTGLALLGLLGLHSRGQAQSPTGLDENGTCRMRFEANVRLGPTVDAASSSAISGLLTISIGDNGGI